METGLRNTVVMPRERSRAQHFPLLLVAGSAFYQYATYVPSQMTCHGLGCGAMQFLVTMEAIEVGLIAACVGLPLTLVGVWMGGWLLRRGGFIHARGQ